MVKSAVYPKLERVPGIQNWVDKAGGLPDYIERIAKHLHYEKGMTISRAIASAVNTVKRWAHMGKVAKYGDPHHMHVSAKTAAEAAKAVAEWEAKRKAGKINLSDALLRAIDLSMVSDEFALDLAEELLDDDGTLDLAAPVCALCKANATKKVIWADGRAYQPSCDQHVKGVQEMLTKKNGEMTELSGVQDLSDAGVEPTDTMVALMLPHDAAHKTSVDGGVPPKDRHVTVTFHGNTTDKQHTDMVNALQEYAKNWQGGPLKGTMGGLGQFPAGDNGTPHYVPVDVPGLNTLHEQVKAVTDGIAPAYDNHGFTPHSTLTYTKDGEAPPAPVPPHPVQFDAIHVVRGNKQRTRIPLGGTSADLAEYVTLGDINIDLARGDVDLQALAARANAVQDPDARAAARQAVLDLAVPKSRLTVASRKKAAKSGAAMPDGSFPITDGTSLKSAIRLARTPAQRAHVIKRARAIGLTSFIPSKWSMDLSETAAKHGLIDLASTVPPVHANGRVSDGRKSFRGQGKWKHGFVPVTSAAADAKAKGSPIAKRRLAKIFGKVSPDPQGAPNSVPGRSHPVVPAKKASKAAPKINEPGGQVHIAEKGHPNQETAQSVGQLVTSSFDPRHAPKVQSPTNRTDKAPKTNPRALQDWNKIPANLKTVRNGKRYVLANFNGRGYLTEWVGGVNTADSTPLAQRKVMRTLAPADAAQMSAAELRDLINNPQVADAVKKVARQALKAMSQEAPRG